MIHTFRTGGDRNLAYVVTDPRTKQAAVIDPSYAPLLLVEHAKEQGLTIRYAFNTHDHPDHTNGNVAFEEATEVRPLKRGSIDPATGTRIEDNATLPLGDLAIRILHTPGHTQDSICLLIDGSLFTGDTLFVGKVGGTDLGTGARAQYESLHRKLMALPAETQVYPGHDVGRTPSSSIGEEKATNPFLLQPDFASFVHLKATWATYKEEHGIA
jgi:hydroxyacylglutathione hydrolase